MCYCKATELPPCWCSIKGLTPSIGIGGIPTTLRMYLASHRPAACSTNSLRIPASACGLAKWEIRDLAWKSTAEAQNSPLQTQTAYSKRSATETAFSSPRVNHSIHITRNPPFPSCPNLYAAANEVHWKGVGPVNHGESGRGHRIRKRNSAY